MNRHVNKDAIYGYKRKQSGVSEFVLSREKDTLKFQRELDKEGKYTVSAVFTFTDDLVIAETNKVKEVSHD